MCTFFSSSENTFWSSKFAPKVLYVVTMFLLIENWTQIVLHRSNNKGTSLRATLEKLTKKWKEKKDTRDIFTAGFLSKSYDHNICAGLVELRFKLSYTSVCRRTICHCIRISNYNTILAGVDLSETRWELC